MSQIALPMASRKNTESVYTTDLHIRLKTDERDALQKKADEFGTTLSQAARRIIFKRVDEMRGNPGDLGEKDIQFRNMQNIQTVAKIFKKVSTDVGRFLVSYERSLALTNQAGRPAVSTEQTIRVAASIAHNQIKLQDGLNEIIRQFGGSEVHVATKPPKGTPIGDFFAGEKSPAVQAQMKKAVPTIEDRPAVTKDINKIPLEFRTMFNLTFDGILVADVETFLVGNYEKIRLQVEVEVYHKGRSRKRVLDAVDFAARYKNVIPHLKKGKEVKISGELDLDVASYNNVQSQSEGTIDIKTLSFKNIFNINFIGTLAKDVETFTDSGYEKIRLFVEVGMVRKGKNKMRVFEAVDFANKYRSVIPVLKRGTVVAINGEFDLNDDEQEEALFNSEGTVDIKSLALPGSL